MKTTDWELVNQIAQDAFPSFLATVVGGLILAIIFFCVRKKCFPLPDLSGGWICCTKTTETRRNPFRGMLLTHKVILLCDGTSITGTSEKIHEKSSTKNGDYIGKDRIRGKVRGAIAKRYFAKDRINIEIIEDGEQRESTISHNLIYESKSRLRGKFITTAGDSKGEANWKRDGTGD